MSEALYSLLSSLYREEPSTESLRNLKEWCQSIRRGKNATEGGVEKLQEFFASTDIDEKLTGELAADYASLFLGIGKHPAHPYESVYTGKDGLVMGEATENVRSLYASENLQKTDICKEPDDHIAIELEFMAFLCHKSNCAMREGDLSEALRLFQVQNGFIEYHLGRWIPLFYDAVARGAETYGLYMAVTQVLLELIQNERQKPAPINKSSLSDEKFNKEIKIHGNH